MRIEYPADQRLVLIIPQRRSTITFATEPITASLKHAISASSASGRRGSTSTSAAVDSELELDEVEIQKGLSQLAKGLQFLHDSAKLVHGNLHDEAVVINAKVSAGGCRMVQRQADIRVTGRLEAGWLRSVDLSLRFSRRACEMGVP